jgi:hypothetical protein
MSECNWRVATCSRCTKYLQFCAECECTATRACFAIRDMCKRTCRRTGKWLLMDISLVLVQQHFSLSSQWKFQHAPLITSTSLLHATRSCTDYTLIRRSRKPIPIDTTIWRHLHLAAIFLPCSRNLPPRWRWMQLIHSGCIRRSLWLDSLPTVSMWIPARQAISNLHAGVR